MGIQARNQLCFCLMLAVIVISMPIILAESSKLYVDDVNETNTISSSPCSKKYITKSYFEKHASLRDPDYQVFMAHEFPCGSCKALPDNLNSMVGVSVPQRNLMGEGSHRHLVSSIKFHLQEAIFELPEHFCQAVVVERLPSGVFADPFELQHLVQQSEFADAAVFGDTNLELPSALTNRSVVEVHMNIGHNKLSRKEKGLEVNIDLPLHARYPPLGESGYARVEMNAPDIFIRCRTEEKLNCSNLLWMMTADYEDLKPGSLIWKIPSGNKSHSGFVSTVTFLSALLSTVLIIRTAIYSPNDHFNKNLKQSYFVQTSACKLRVVALFILLTFSTFDDVRSFTYMVHKTFGPQY